DQYRVFKPDGSMVNIPSLTLDEIKAIVNEAHRRDLKVACHAYGGEALHSCIEAGVDLTMHAPALDQESVNLLVHKKLPLMFTLDDLIGLEKGDLKITGGKESRLSLTEAAFKKAQAAGIPMPFGSGASTGSDFPLGKEANQFAWFVKWGMSPAHALETAFTVAASVLNYNWADQVGTLEKGKYADIIAVAGNPLADVSAMEHVNFVMKGGVVVRNDLQ
ncbi:MAG: amidohydrolase family protein, partial [Terriglobia bacterium]